MTTTSKTTAQYDIEAGSLRGVRLFLVLTPCVASRPRVTRWGTYYAKTYKNWMALAAETIPDAKHMIHVPCSVAILFVCKRPVKLTRVTPVGDIDNYAKAILDALTKKDYWTDDDLVDELSLNKRYAAPGEAPYITVRITPAP